MPILPGTSSCTKDPPPTPQLPGTLGSSSKLHSDMAAPHPGPWACLDRPPCCALQPFPQAPCCRLPCSQSPTLPGPHVLNMHSWVPEGTQSVTWSWTCHRSSRNRLGLSQGAAGRLVSGFGSGAAFSWVSGMTPTPQGVFTSAVLMALTQGAFYKVPLPRP